MSGLRVPTSCKNLTGTPPAGGVLSSHRVNAGGYPERSCDEQPEVAYGHLQLFSRAKLEAIGTWCIQQLQGTGRMWCEDFIGGLLLIERRP